MKIIAHRGLWTRSEEQNTLEALRAAVDAGFGIETDVWAWGLHGVISHDPPSPSASVVTLEDVVALQHDGQTFLALNVKSDGVVPILSSLREKLDGWRWAAFDMSIPETIRIEKSDLPFLRRVSRIECEPSELIGLGYWVDTQDRVVPRLKDQSRFIAYVSPELHGYEHHEVWQEIRDRHTDSPDVAICTDFPHEADRFFNGAR
jgi:hypothetical protein